MKRVLYLLPLIAIASCQPSSKKVVGDAPINLNWALADKADWYPLTVEAGPNFKLDRLDTTPLPKGDREIRLYGGFGLGGMDTVVLRQKGGTWSGEYLGPVGEQYKRELIGKKLRTPAEGWDKFIRRLEVLGLFNLPEADWLEPQNMGFDGHSYVVVVQQYGTFRYVVYPLPDIQHRWLSAYALMTCVELLTLLHTPYTKPHGDRGPGATLRWMARYAPDDRDERGWRYIDHMAWRAKDPNDRWYALPEPPAWMLSDIDGNGIANEKDLAIVRANLGKKTAPYKPLLPADANGDGVVDQIDIAIVTPAANLNFKMPWTDGSYP